MLLLPWKIMFSFILIIGSLIAMSASSWLMAWMGLEINMLALLALLMNTKSPRNSEATLKYFLIQALASALMISSAFSASAVYSSTPFLVPLYSLLVISLIIKLGGAPFHLWLPQVVEGLSWINNLVILSWQKLAPFILLFSCLEMKTSKPIIIIATFLSAIMGGIGGLNNTSIRKILAFSSINHLGWMLSSMLTKFITWAIYFSLYVMMLFLLITSIKLLNITSISHSNFSLSTKSQIPFFISLLSFAGLPPFMGFLPKLTVINELSQTSMMIVLTLILSSLLTLFFYLRITFTSMLSKSFFMKKSNPSPNFNTWVLAVNLWGLCFLPYMLL